MEDISQLQKEVDRTDRLLSECELQIITLQGLIAHQKGGGTKIYDAAPPPAFEISEYKKEEREKYGKEVLRKTGQDIFQKNGNKILEDLENSLSNYQNKLPGLIKQYESACAVYDKAVNSQKSKS